jgi:hypothetical protein
MKYSVKLKTTEVSAQQAIYTTTSYKTGPSDIKSATFTHLRYR